MTKRQSSKLNMYLVVITFCEEPQYQALIASIPALTSAYNAFKAAVTAIQFIGTFLAASSIGISEAKKVSKKNLARFGSNIAGVVSAYAVSTNNEELKGEMEIFESDIYRASGLAPVEICNLIYDRANTNIVALADYGITPAILTAFTNAIANFDSNEPKPKLTIEIKKAKHIEEKQLFTDADAILEEKIDKLIINFEGTNDNFVATYFAARKTVKPAVATTVLKLRIVNIANDMPIKNARAYHNGNPGPKRSSTKGIITYKSPAEGNHYYIIKHALFQNITTEKIMIAHGERKTITVKMIAL